MKLSKKQIEFVSETLPVVLLLLMAVVYILNAPMKYEDRPVNEDRSITLKVSTCTRENTVQGAEYENNSTTQLSEFPNHPGIQVLELPRATHNDRLAPPQAAVDIICHDCPQYWNK